MMRRTAILTMLFTMAAGRVAGCGDDNAGKASGHASKALLTIAGASDLRPTFNELGELYRAPARRPDVGAAIRRRAS